MCFSSFFFVLKEMFVYECILYERNHATSSVFLNEARLVPCHMTHTHRRYRIDDQEKTMRYKQAIYFCIIRAFCSLTPGFFFLINSGNVIRKYIVSVLTSRNIIPPRVCLYVKRLFFFVPYFPYYIFAYTTS